jgi:glycerol-3-phosphate dehydrogenase
MDEPPDNVVEFRPPPIRFKRAEGIDCRHLAIEYCVAQRTVVCDTCKAVLDPFTVLVDLGDSYVATQALIDDTERRAEQLESRLIQLERHERNLKNRIKRLGGQPITVRSIAAIEVGDHVEFAFDDDPPRRVHRKVARDIVDVLSQATRNAYERNQR